MLLGSIIVTPEDEALRTQLSEKSLEAARSRHSAEHMADSYLNGGKDDR